MTQTQTMRWRGGGGSLWEGSDYGLPDLRKDHKEGMVPLLPSIFV